MKHQLALVIPAYKASYLDATLASIAGQTSKDFTVYIGNDASPEPIREIVAAYTAKLDIVYHEFPVNLGGKDLVAHWERCVDLVQGEEWVWLFSDDDLMAKDCVEIFYAYIHKHPDRDLLHYPVTMIDGEGKVMQPAPVFPEHMAALDFFRERVNYRIKSYVVEYIFKKKLYDEQGGFVNFDLAWCADDATWIKFGKKSGIYTLPGGTVFWRYSGSNISHINNEQSIVVRKIQAAINYMQWTDMHLPGSREQVSKLKKVRWVMGSVNNLAAFPMPFKCRWYRKTLGRMGAGYYLSPSVVLWCLAAITRDSVKKRSSK